MIEQNVQIKDVQVLHTQRKKVNKVVVLDILLFYFYVYFSSVCVCVRVLVCANLLSLRFWCAPVRLGLGSALIALVCLHPRVLVNTIWLRVRVRLNCTSLSSP